MSLNFKSENAVEINHLVKRYKGFELKDVSFNIPAGCVTGFIGQNGVGKTTTIKSILNMISRDEGEIKIFGCDNIKNAMEIKQNIGVVFDDICFHERLQPKQIDKILKGIYKEWDSEVFFDYLKKLNLPEKKKVGELSRGMQMKLQIATALSHHAKLLIMDEPTGGLDPVVRNEILDIFMDFIQDGENTILLSSHIITDIERIADYIVFINQGRILLSEDKETVGQRHGVIKCSEEEFQKIAPEDVISTRKSTFGVEALVGDMEGCRKKYSNLLCEKTTLEDTFLFYARYGSK